MFELLQGFAMALALLGQVSYPISCLPTAEFTLSSSSVTQLGSG